MEIKIQLNKPLRKYWAMLAVYPDILAGLREQITDELPANVFDYLGMTIREFLQLTEAVFPAKIQKMLNSRKLLVSDYLKILNTFENGSKNFEAIIENTTIEDDSDEKMAKSGLLEVTTEEAMLNFMCEAFGLKGWEQAQEMTLYEYVSARKKSYNTIMFQKNLNEIKKNKL